MKKGPKEPAIPVSMHHTMRHEILSELEQGLRSAGEISREVRISEREVYDHLEHIRKTASRSAKHLVITPAECRRCGFIFSKRERLRKPGRCPLCRGESIKEALFSIGDRFSKR
ncbi:MAG TPA: transcriptional regulator [Nitrospirota bacterium]|nr:transcriptional regulator [Nitrospirota bacterium]